jgi:ubiquinone biosynthesis protein
MERWMRSQVGPKAFARKLQKNLPQITEYAADMPLLAHKVLRDAADGQLELVWKSQELTQLRSDLARSQRSLLGAVSGGALLIVATLLLTLGPGPLLGPAAAGWLSSLLGAAGCLLLLRAWVRG